MMLIFSAPLQLASQYGCEDLVKLFIQHGADVNFNEWRSSALISATENGHEKIVKLLIESGADLHSEDT